MRSKVAAQNRMAPRPKKPPPPVAPPPTTLSALEWLFDNEETLPKEPSALMKRIGWVWAQRQYASGDSEWHDLHPRLMEACSHSMTFTYDPGASVMINNASLNDAGRTPPPGWRIVTITHMEASDRIEGGKCTFGYHSASGKFHAVVWAKRSDTHHHAFFELNGHRIYMFQVHSSNANDNPQVFFVMLATWAVTVHSPLHVVHPTSGMFAYARCWPPIQTETHVPFFRSHDCVQLWYFTESNTVIYAQNKYRFMESTSDQPQPFPLDVDAVLLNKFTDYDEDTLLDHRAGPRGDRIWKFERGLKLVAPTNLQAIMLVRGRKVEISNFLTNQLRRRHLRVARKLLYTKLQEAEEDFAEDPVRRCAACAIESVKHQLALGMVGDDAPKRQRVE